MTKRRKLKRAEQPKPEGVSGYAARRKLPWSERHKHHTRRVHACPYCAPGSAQQEPSPSLRSTLSQGVDMAGINE